jgi:hypothetical protein
MQARSVAVFGQPSSIRPELTGIALALEGCPAEEDLNILTDSLSSMRLLMGMQRRNLPLSLCRHSVRLLLLHVVKQINKRAEAGRRTRFIKVRAHSGGGLNEAADAMAAAAAESDPARTMAMDLVPKAVYFLYKEAWVEWNARVREDMVQRAAERCVTRTLRPKRERAGEEASPPTLPLTASWLLRPNQGRSTLGKVLGEMRIYSEEASAPTAPVHCRSVPLQCRAPQVGYRALSGLRSLRPSGRDTEPHPVPLPGT